MESRIYLYVCMYILLPLNILSGFCLGIYMHKHIHVCMYVTIIKKETMILKENNEIYMGRFQGISSKAYMLSVNSWENFLLLKGEDGKWMGMLVDVEREEMG